MDSTLQTKLDTLQLYLSNLPESLPLPEPTQATYPFDLFEITPEDLEDYGETGAVNRELEIAFGTRRDGPIVFVERGPVLVQVIDILRIYLQKDPTSAILQKWLPTASRQPTELTGAFRGPSTMPAVATTSKKSSRSVQKLDSKKISDTNDPAYEDVPEAEDHRKGRAKLLPLLSKVSIHCRSKDKPSEERAGCIELDPDAARAERTMFTLGGRSDIDITSPYLRDILSDTDISQKRRDTGMARKEKTPGMATAVSNAPPASSDWETWW